MCSNRLYKSCQQCPWGPYSSRPDNVFIYHMLIMGNTCKIFFSETTICFVHVCSNCYEELSKKPFHSNPWDKKWPHPWGHFCVAMLSNPLYISCHLVTWVLYWPHHRAEHINYPTSKTVQSGERLQGHLSSSFNFVLRPFQNHAAQTQRRKPSNL